VIQSIGNDIVDLLDPQAQNQVHQPRFLKRVCSPEEQQEVRNASDPHATLWTLWACKEASFKAIQKRMPDARFIPNQYVCSRDGRHPNQNFWRCSFKHLHCRLIVEQSTDCVHCIASLDPSPEMEIIKDIDIVPAGINPSQAVREQALKLLERQGYRGCSIVRMVHPPYFLPPEVFYKDRPLAGCDISLSHDGRFIGTAL
jgi:phosphopantetheine--protein transferase-like protein